MSFDDLLAEDPQLWVDALPEYQRDPLNELLLAGAGYEEVAEQWLTATASNVYPFGAANSIGDRSSYLKSVKSELRAFLCGGKKYEADRKGLFGKDSPARMLVVNTIAAAIASQISVAAVVIAPVVALILASIGKVTVNAWCEMKE